MMAKITANINIDPEVKAQAQELFADFGMDLSTAINIFLRQAIRENAIPFAITRNVPNAVTMAAFDASEKEYDEYVETMLDEADEYAKSTDERLTHEEVFQSLRRNLNAG